MEKASSYESQLQDVYLIHPQWALIFFVVGAAFLLLIGIPVRFLTGLSASSDKVFAVEALISGLCVDALLRLKFKKRMVVSKKIRIPFIYLWPALCIFVFIFGLID